MTQPIDDKTSLTDDERIENIVPLPPPEHLIRFFPIQNTPVEKLVSDTRKRVREIVRGKSDRLLVIIGPCSIHDPAAAVAYAEKLLNEREKSMKRSWRWSCASISRSRAPRWAGRG